jgi:hypothetical protein
MALSLVAIAIVAVAAVAGSIPAAASCGHDHHQTDTHRADAHHAHSASADASAPMTAMHGGTVTQVDDLVFETVLGADGVRVYAYGADGVPVDVESASGAAKLTLADGESRDIELASRAPADGEPALYYCPMHPGMTQHEPGQCEACGGMTLFQQNLLFGSMMLPESTSGPVETQVRVDDLPATDETVTYVAQLAVGTDHDADHGAPSTDTGDHDRASDD